jgi:hypothetical protein
VVLQGRALRRTFPSIQVRHAGMAIATALAIATLAFLPVTAHAAALNVCPSGCPFATIQAAMSAAQSGDMIAVAPGTYPGGVTVSQNVTLVGSGTALTTIQGGGPVVLIPAGVTVSIKDITITGGNVVGRGGGIANYGTLSVKDVLVNANFASISGGGIANFGSITVLSSVISGNQAGFAGGGIAGSVTLSNSTVVGNTAANGGGMAAQSPATVTDTTIANNRATSVGGGVATVNAFDLENSTVTGNLAQNGGGIAFIGSLSVSNSAIAANTATQEGGGIFLATSLGAGTATLTESTVSQNIPDNCFPPGSISGCTG